METETRNPEPARVAVTGGGGFIGHSLVVDQARRGHRVRSLDVKHSEPLPPDLGQSPERIDGTILDEADLDRTFAGCETVFHLASAHRAKRLLRERAHRLYPYLVNRVGQKQDLDPPLLEYLQVRGIRELGVVGAGQVIDGVLFRLHAGNV